MSGRRQWSGALVALAAAALLPIAPAEGTDLAAASVPARHFPVAAAPVPPPHASPAAARARGPHARLAPLPHEIPADVIVRAFVRAEGGALRLVLRVPLTSMRDVDFPVRGPGYVEIDEASLLLDDLATLWIAGYVTLYEEAARLPAPVVTATPDFAPLGPLLRRLRSGRCAHVGPCDPVRRRPGSGTGHARRGARNPHPVCRFTFLDRSRLGASGDPHDHGAALRYPGRRGAGLPVHGQSRAGTPRPAVAPGAAALRGARLRPHPGRNRPPPLSAVPGRSPAAPVAARVGGDGVHGRALDHAGRFGAGSRAQRASGSPR